MFFELRKQIMLAVLEIFSTQTEQKITKHCVYFIIIIVTEKCLSKCVKVYERRHSLLRARQNPYYYYKTSTETNHIRKSVFYQSATRAAVSTI